MESTDCGYICPYEKSRESISVCDDTLKMKSDSFQMDMEPFSHLTINKDITFNSRFGLQRCSSRKGEEKKMSNSSVDDEKDATSPKAIMTEKLIPVTIMTVEPKVHHHQISIVTTTTTESPTKSRLVGKRSSSFKQTSIINPRRIMFFFATLSSMGTILLIYFTLSMAKHNGDDNLLDQ